MLWNIRPVRYASFPFVSGLYVRKQYHSRIQNECSESRILPKIISDLCWNYIYVSKRYTHTYTHTHTHTHTDGGTDTHILLVTWFNVCKNWKALLLDQTGRGIWCVSVCAHVWVTACLEKYIPSEHTRTLTETVTYIQIEEFLPRAQTQKKSLIMSCV